MTKIFLTLLLVVVSFAVQAQNMLGATYKEVKRNYNTNTDYFGWEELKTEDGETFVKYLSKSYDRTMMCIFKNGVVNRYLLAGFEQEMVSFRAHLCLTYTITSDTTWVDEKRKCQWSVIVEDDLAYYIAQPLVE